MPAQQDNARLSRYALMALQLNRFEIDDSTPNHKRPNLTDVQWELLSIIADLPLNEFFKPHIRPRVKHEHSYLALAALGFNRADLRVLLRNDLIYSLATLDRSDVHFYLTDVGESLFMAHKIAGKYRHERGFISGLHEEDEHALWHIWFVMSDDDGIAGDSNMRVIIKDLTEDTDIDNATWKAYSAATMGAPSRGIAYRVLFDNGWHTPVSKYVRETKAYLRELYILDDDDYQKLTAERTEENMSDTWRGLVNRYGVEPELWKDLPQDRRQALLDKLTEIDPNWEESVDDRGADPDDSMVLAVHMLGWVDLTEQKNQRDAALSVALAIRGRPDAKPEHKDMPVLQLANKVILPLWWRHREKCSFNVDSFQRLVTTLLGYQQFPFPPVK